MNKNTNITFQNKYGVNVKIFRNENVKVDKNALEELEQLLNLSDTVNNIKNQDQDFFDIEDPKILDVAVTPDFHKGAGIPIGTVMATKGFLLPQAIGNDVNCGMRLYKTDLTESQIRDKLLSLEKRIRYIFFEGGRGIPMTSIQRQSLLKEGLVGLNQTYKEGKNEGLWKYYDPIQQEKDLANVNNSGSHITKDIFALDDFLGNEKLSYDNQIGSIGGGNHFVEVQKVSEILDNKTAFAWGLKKEQIVIMIHTGSVSIGHITGSYFKDLLKEIYPKELKHPKNGIFILPDSEKYKNELELFFTSLSNAANFGFGNRMFLGLMIQKALLDEFGSVTFELLYDATHNFVWKEKIDGEDCYLHRKGACPSRGIEQMEGTKFEFYGEPVIIPGSMGSSSYILAGLGNRDSLFSSSHGAGRTLSRGESTNYNDVLFRDFINKFKIITPIDPNSPALKKRSDIIKKWEDDLKQEAPYAYKDISPVIQTHVDNNMAKPIVKLDPIFTIKS